MSIGLCVIGSGKIFQNYHLMSIIKLNEFEIRYIVDKNLNLAKLVAAKVGAVATDDISSVKDCQICLVATPPSTRVAIFDVVKKMGMHIVFEKPISFDYESAKYIVDESKKYNIKVMVAHTRRFFPNLNFVRNLVKNNFFANEGIDISYYEGGIFGWVTESNYMASEASKDQGVIHDIGSHVFDYLLLLLEDLGVCFKDIKILESVKDYESHANNCYVRFEIGNAIVNVKLSRNTLLMNKLVVSQGRRRIYCKSGYDNNVSVSIQEFEFQIPVLNKYLQGTDLESAFDLMWFSILHKIKYLDYPDALLSIDAETVLDNTMLIDRIINDSVISKQFFNYE